MCKNNLERIYFCLWSSYILKRLPCFTPKLFGYSRYSNYIILVSSPLVKFIDA